MSVKKIIVGVLGLAVVATVAIVFLILSHSESGPLAARRHAMEMLGARIAQLAPNCKVLVLSNPFSKKSGFFDEKSEYERVSISGLRKGLGGHSRVTVVFPEIRPEYFANPQSVVIPPDSRTPLSFLMQSASVDQLAAAHPECRVIVSLIGLPADVERLKIWNEKEPQCFALLLPDLRLLGPPAEAVEAFKQGKLLAAVHYDPTSDDPLIVTRDNVVEVLNREPRVLGY